MSAVSDREKEILEYWEKERIFERSVAERPENKPYVFYDGPPFATGLPHYGHILSSVIKDVVPRYWTMRGYRVRRRWGWDCHGLPIENLIEKKLRISGKKEITEQGVEHFNEACRSAVLTYTSEWKEMVRRIGRWVEFDNAYKTMDSTYMESVWWALKIIWEKGLIYEGLKVLLYCPHCETPVSKAEIAMDNSYQDITEEAVTVEFRIKGKKDTSILAWTTTPWTLPGNVALAVGPDISYVTVEKKDEGVGSLVRFVLAKERLHAVFGDDELVVIQEQKGSDLVGLEYEPLFDVPAVRKSGKRAYGVVAADFVTTEDGTGVVHTAVMYGEDDYNLGTALDMPMVQLLNDRGEYNEHAPESLRGMYIRQAEKTIKKELADRGLLFAREQNTHSYPHCWRCETPLIYNAIPAWFINIQKIKSRLIELNEKIHWYPEYLKHGRFLNILQTAPDWNISRNRYWATPLPFWRCTNKEAKCTNVVCVGSVSELKERSTNFDAVFSSDDVAAIDLHKHVVDQVKLKCDACGGFMERIPEVIDCWVESASMPFAEFHYPFENEDVFKNRFPGRYIAEYIAQTRAWFYYMHVMSTLLFDDISFEYCVTTGTILNEKGEKLSKSKMNYTDPWKIIDEYGVDTLRYYLMTSVVMSADNLFFNDRDVRESYNKVVNTLWNVVEYYAMYSQENWEAPSSEKKVHTLDRWILSKTQGLVAQVTDHMDAYDTVRAGRPLRAFIEDLSTWYLRRSRDRFKSDDETERYEARKTLEHVLRTLSLVIAPFMPFMAEMIHRELQNAGRLQLKDSVHLEEWPHANEALVDAKLEDDMFSARVVVESVHSLRASAKIKVRQPLSAVVCNYDLSDELRDIIADEVNVKEVRREQSIPQQEGWLVKEDGSNYSALCTELTDALREEGMVRELVRSINALRKERGFTVQDVLTLAITTDDEGLHTLIDRHAEQLKKQTLLKDILFEKRNDASEVTINEKKAAISLVA